MKETGLNISASTKPSPRVQILLLNWNSGEEFINCFKGIKNLDYENIGLVIVDNDSDDNSWNLIKETLENEPSFKWSYSTLNEDSDPEKESLEKNVFLIKNKDNYGYGKGNNIGIRFLEKHLDWDHLWMLNMDASPKKNALTEMVSYMERDHKMGMLGSVLIFDDGLDKVQTLGGARFFRWIGIPKLIKKHFPVGRLSEINQKKEEEKLDYIMGASMLIRRKLIEEVGIFDEDYFLYAEDLDWGHRAKTAGWKLGFEPKSHILHYGSSSTSSAKHIFYFHMNRSCLIFMRKHYGLMSAIPCIIPIFANNILKTRNWKNLTYALKGIREGITSSLTS